MVSSILTFLAPLCYSSYLYCLPLSLSLSLSLTHTHTHTRTPLMFYLLPQEGNRVHNPDKGISSFWSPSCAQLNTYNSHSQESCQTSFST